MSFFQKQIEDITFSDVKELVDNQISESYDLDYKEDYPEGKKLVQINYFGFKILFLKNHVIPLILKQYSSNKDLLISIYRMNLVGLFPNLQIGI
jgi:hypothetical protein